MGDFNFENLGPRSFEHIVQALAVKYVGPGVTIFGDGPDGAREAAFNGQSHYPAGQDSWDGYIVIQAKYLQTPRHSVEDVTWLCGQLRSELQKFADNERGLRVPKYYIFASNVRLSSISPRTSRRGKPVLGGKDRISAVFDEFPDLPIEAWDVWDYDKLRAYLEDSSDIRGSYAAWITPSDLIMNLMSSINGYQAAFEDTMWRTLRGICEKANLASFSKLATMGKELSPWRLYLLIFPFHNHLLGTRATLTLPRRVCYFPMQTTGTILIAFTRGASRYAIWENPTPSREIDS
jgi:hypothetical protein